MDIQTIMVTIPEIEINQRYTVSAATTLVINEHPEIIIVTINALIGTPFEDNFFKGFGPILLFDNDQSIREAA